jgi:hypothetical protein
MLRHTSHGQWVKRLKEQCPHAADEHRCIGVHGVDGAIWAEPTRACGSHDGLTLFLGVVSHYSVAESICDGASHRLHTIGEWCWGGAHISIVPAKRRHRTY